MKRAADILLAGAGIVLLSPLWLLAALLIRLVFPDDALLLARPTAAEIRKIQSWLWEVARRYVARP